jgi:general secretion pathway protein G
MVKFSRKFSKGFTLIEMLVVLAIVALLLTIALPRYFGALGKSKLIVLQQNLQVVRRSIDQFQSDKGRYPKTLEELVEFQYLRSMPVDPITESSRTWVLLAPPVSGKGGVYDLRSGAQGIAEDGKPYAQF